MESKLRILHLHVQGNKSPPVATNPSRATVLEWTKQHGKKPCTLAEDPNHRAVQLLQDVAPLQPIT